MRTKRIGRWVIVLFLLAALPGLTAVLAQEHEPEPGKALSKSTGLGESGPGPAWYANRHESEPNDSAGAANAIYLGDVMEGLICEPGRWLDCSLRKRYDEDWFKFSVTQQGAIPILIDIEAQYGTTYGSNLNSRVCLIDSGGVKELACNDDTDTQDSMLYFNVSPGDYYIRVQDSSGRHGDDSYSYFVLLSSPTLVSAAAAGLRTGHVYNDNPEVIDFEAQDILAHSDYAIGMQRWRLLFDGSDLGITMNLMNLSNSWPGTGLLQLGFRSNVQLPGIAQTVTPFDWVYFIPTRIGAQTEGTFHEDVWQGRFAPLTNSGERLDALDFWYDLAAPYQGLFYSIVGWAQVRTWEGKDIYLDAEDVGLWFDTGGEVTERFLEGAAVPGLEQENVIAMSIAQHSGGLYFTISGNGMINGVPVDQADIVYVDPLNPTSSSIAWHGPDHGWNYNIDAFEYNGW